MDEILMEEDIKFIECNSSQYSQFITLFNNLQKIWNKSFQIFCRVSNFLLDLSYVALFSTLRKQFSSLGNISIPVSPSHLFPFSFPIHSSWLLSYS